jgi:hypothetical protein
MRPWHLQDQVCIVRDSHELGECRPSQKIVVCNLKISNLKLYVLRQEVFPSLEGHGKEDLADGCCC